MLERQEQTSARRSSNVKSEVKSNDKTITKSAPASYKSKEPLERVTSATSRHKKESLVPKTIRTHTNSTGSIGAVPPRIPRERDVPSRVPIDSGRTESYYSLPNSKLRVETGQKTRKLQDTDGPSVNINAASKVSKGINTTPRRGEPIPVANAVMTDLTQVNNQFDTEAQPQTYRGFEGHRQGQIKYPSNNPGASSVHSSSSVPFGANNNNNDGSLERGRSASSSSSHDDNSLGEPRSWSCTNDQRSDREVSLHKPSSSSHSLGTVFFFKWHNFLLPS